MLNKILKYTIVPLVYNLLGIIFFYNQDLLIVSFTSLCAVLFHLMINENKTWLRNFLELNSIFIILFSIAYFLIESDKTLILRYLSLTAIVFSVIYLLKIKKFNLTE
jgi:hypothetical protein